MPGWVQSRAMLDINSDKAQMYHKSIFEMMILDLIPFSSVNKPGFLRHHYRLVPNFNLASDKYYRDMLDPAYQKIRSALQDRVKADAPPTFSVGLDGWSHHHHGYLGK